MNSKATVPDLKELFKQAAEIAKQVPESMQEAAFNRAIDLLTEGIPASNKTQNPKKSTVGRSSQKTGNSAPTAPTSADDPLADLLESIDSTQHPGVGAASRVLDRALMVLQIALHDHDVDGLTPPQIATILTEKFRVRTTKESVSMALGKATNLVNRVSKGQGFLYKIMSPGEAHLAKTDESELDASPTRPKTRRRKAPRRRKSSTEPKITVVESSVSKPTRKVDKKGTSAGSTKVGPKAAVKSLINAGYFDTARTGPEIHEHLTKKRGLKFGVAQIRLVLLRLVRDEKLERDENAEGNYEYSVSKS